MRSDFYQILRDKTRKHTSSTLPNWGAGHSPDMASSLAVARPSPAQRFLGTMGATTRGGRFGAQRALTRNAEPEEAPVMITVFLEGCEANWADRKQTARSASNRSCAQLLLLYLSRRHQRRPFSRRSSDARRGLSCSANSEAMLRVQQHGHTWPKL